MRIILLGAPGAGKGSVGKPLSAKLGVPVISTGDIFRYNITQHTELGKIVKLYIDNGTLVPDEITVSIIADRLRNDDCISGFILDGFPRTLFQAQELDRILESMDNQLDIVLNVVLSDEKIITRLSNRMICSKCGETYNAITKKPVKAGICDICGENVIVREDDAPQTVKCRLDTYHTKTQPLIEYYAAKDLLVSINNDCTIAQGLENVMIAIDGFMKRNQS